MLRPLRKANAETRRVLSKALKTEAHSPLCKLYIYKQIYLDPVLFCYQTAFCTTSRVEHAFLFVSLL